MHSFPNLFRYLKYSVGRESKYLIISLGSHILVLPHGKSALTVMCFFSTNQGLATLLLQIFIMKCPPVWRKYAKQKGVFFFKYVTV